MGCGASVEPNVEPTAPEKPEDPLEKLHREIQRLRGQLNGVLPPHAESAKKWRYMSVTLGKLKCLNNHIGDDLDDEKLMFDALTYHIAEQDAQDLYDASEGFGTDEEKMGRVILGRLPENIMLTDQIYRQRHGRSLEDLVRGENKTLLGLLGADSLSHFGRFLTYRTMPQPKRDALLFRGCMSGWGCADFILIELLSTRTNAELQAAANFYAAEFDGEDMVERIKSETGGFGKKWYGKWIDTLVEFDRDESGEVQGDPAELAKKLYDAGAGKWMGTDEQVFIDVLCKANEPTCVAIAEAYDNLAESKRSLVADIEKEMGGDLEFAALARVKPRMEFFAWRVYKACKGWGTDEQCICRVLGCLDNDEVQRLAAKYNEMYAEEEGNFKDFSALLESELSGSLLDGIRHLLESLPPKNHWDSKDTYEPVAACEADAFRGHLEDNFDDEKAMLLGDTDLDGGLHLLNVDQHFLCDGYDYSIPHDHDRHEDWDAAHLLEGPLPGDVDKCQDLIKRLKSTISEVQDETEKNNAAVEGSRAIYYDRSRDMRFKDHHLRQLLSDNDAMLEFCAQRDADAVHEAVEGWGTDEDRLIKILCSLTKKQLRRVDDIYAERYGKTLRDVCDEELGGMFEDNFKYFMKCVMTPAGELDAELLRDSMAGLGTNDTLLIEICCTRTNKELRDARAAFQAKEGKSVEEWIEGDTSGFYTAFLLKCLQGNRQEGEIDERLAKKQARKLHNAGLDGSSDKDEKVLMNIMAHASEDQMGFIKEAYKNQFGKELMDAIKDALGGDFERAFVCRAQDRLTYYATKLHEAFAGLGTDEKTTSRIIGRNTKADVLRIGARMEELFGGSLRQRINGETSGNYKKALLTYLYAEGPGPADEGQLEVAPLDECEEGAVEEE